MHLAERISTSRRLHGLSARQLAAMVDVAPSTVVRIESGAVSPSFDLAQEILSALGEPIGFTGVADTSAIAAARLSLSSGLNIAVTPGVVVWWGRWRRVGLVDDTGCVLPGREADLLQRAGRVARLTRRPGAVDFQPWLDAVGIARSLTDADLEYALTGDAGANAYRPSATEAWPVLYVQDVDVAARAAGLTRKEPGAFGRRVTLIPFDGISETGRQDVAGVTVAALEQVALDGYGGIDRMAEQADLLLGQRVE